MEIIVDKRAQKFVGNQTSSDQAKILRYLDLFKQYGFKLTVKYLKKIDQAIWELRPSDTRVFLGKIKKDDLIVVLHCYMELTSINWIKVSSMKMKHWPINPIWKCFIYRKQTQKTPQKEIETARLRLKEYFS